MLRGNRVLVTGGTGFVGARLVERLAADGAEIVLFMRDAMTATRAGRYAVDMRIAELSDRRVLTDAAADCDLIFHLAHDVGRLDSADTNRRAAELVGACARERGVRVVYASSAEVYGARYFGAGELDESAPLRPTKNRAYAQSKLEVENVLLAGDAVVVQAPIVYGPYSKPWVHDTLEAMRSGWIVVPDDGRGSMNAVYVDDFVDALVAAGTTDGIGGERFLVSGSTVRWSQYFERCEQMLAREAVTYTSTTRDLHRVTWAVTKQGVRDLFSAVADEEMLKRAERIPIVERGFDAARLRLPQIWKSLKGQRDEVPFIAGPPSPPAPRTPPSDARLHLPGAHRRALYESDVRIGCAKAERILGYRPKFSFDDGMAIVEDFARWANLL